MGNQLARDYQIEEKPIASGGIHHLWRVHSAVHKTTKQEVSIFICNVKDLETKYGKSNVSKVVQRLRNDANILTRLKHPHILKLQQPLYESSKEIALVTEPVIGSLPNLLHQDYAGVPGGSSAVPPQFKNYGFHELELKYGLAQILEGVQFCHQEAKLIHLNIIPHNIFVATNGAWKLAGFQFSFYKNYASNVAAPVTQQENEVITYDTRQRTTKGFFVPMLDFAAPEYVLTGKPDYASDMFSIGCILYQFLSQDKRTSLLKANESIDEYRSSIKYTQSLAMNHLPEKTRDAIRFLLHENPDNRPSAQEILTTEAFSHLFGEEVRAFRVLNVLRLQDAVKKAQFLKQFEVLLSKTSAFPERILHQVVLPSLLVELRDLKTVVFALPCVMYIAEKMGQKQFSNLILPTLSKVFMYTQPQKVPLILLQQFDVLLNKTTPTQHKNFIIPFLVRCLESQFPDVLAEALKRAEQCFSQRLLNYQDFKQQVLPRIQTLATTTKSATVRINAVVSLGKSSPQLDKEAIVEIVLPVLEHCLIADRSNNSLMTVVGVYLKICKTPNLVSAEDVARRVLPAILPVATEKSLNYDQFEKYMRAVRFMLGQIEEERTKAFSEARQLEQESGVMSEHSTEPETPQYDGEHTPETIEDFKAPEPLPKITTPTSGLSKPSPSAPPAAVDDDDDFYSKPMVTEKPKPQPVPVAPKPAVDDHFDNLLSRFADRPKPAERPVSAFEPVAPKPVTVDESFVSPVTTPSPAPVPTPVVETKKQAPGFDHLLNQFMGSDEVPNKRKSSLLVEPAKESAPVGFGNEDFSSVKDPWFDNHGSGSMSGSVTSSVSYPTLPQETQSDYSSMYRPTVQDSFYEQPVQPAVPKTTPAPATNSLSIFEQYHALHTSQPTSSSMTSSFGGSSFGGSSFGSGFNNSATEEPAVTTAPPKASGNLDHFDLLLNKFDSTPVQKSISSFASSALSSAVSTGVSTGINMAAQEWNSAPQQQAPPASNPQIQPKAGLDYINNFFGNTSATQSFGGFDPSPVTTAVKTAAVSAAQNAASSSTPFDFEAALNHINSNATRLISKSTTPSVKPLPSTDEDFWN